MQRFAEENKSPPLPIACLVRTSQLVFALVRRQTPDVSNASHLFLLGTGYGDYGLFTRHIRTPGLRWSCASWAMQGAHVSWPGGSQHQDLFSAHERMLVVRRSGEPAELELFSVELLRFVFLRRHVSLSGREEALQFPVTGSIPF